MTTIAQVLIKAFHQAGVKRIYGIVGDSLNALTQVLMEEKSIQWVHTRHEEVAAFAAGAEAQLTGELTVCAGSCGPGNLHLINGLYDCHRNQVPVLVIAAHIPTVEIGSDYFQETHPQILFKECSHFCELVSSPEQFPRLLHIAMHTALSRRGVSVLVISGDMMSKKVSDEDDFLWQPISLPVVVPNQSTLQEAAKLINSTTKVTLFCGFGAANAHDWVVKIAEKIQAPVVHTLRGKAFIEYDNPCDVGMTGFIGFASGYYAMESCETLILIGTSFPYRQFYPKHAHIIQIDLEGQQLGKRSPIHLGLVGDAAATLQALLPLLDAKKTSDHLQQARDHYQKSRDQLNKWTSIETNKDTIHPQYVAHLINKHANNDAIFTCDVGTPTVWAARYLQMNGKRQLLGSFNHGSMANALAQAIGAQFTYPERQVIAICGDGGLSMLLGDILTLIQHAIPVKIVVLNNQSLEFVKLEMHAVGLLDFGTDLCETNFANIAQAVKILGVRVDKSEQLESGLQQILTHKGPAVLDVKVNPNELIIPPSITIENVKGFGLYLLKALLDGQGKEIFDLAKNNLWA